MIKCDVMRNKIYNYDDFISYDYIIAYPINLNINLNYSYVGVSGTNSRIKAIYKAEKEHFQTGDTYVVIQNF